MKRTLVLLMTAMALLLNVGCGEKDTDTGNQSVSGGMTDAQYKEYLKGGTWNHMVDTYYGFDIKFGAKADNSVSMNIIGEDVFGVMAEGSYSLSNGIITANYTSVMLFADYVDWSNSQFRGFQNNVPCTRKYTIVSCSEPYLTLKTESGETYKFERKNY